MFKCNKCNGTRQAVVDGRPACLDCAILNRVERTITAALKELEDTTDLRVCGMTLVYEVRINNGPGSNEKPFLTRFKGPAVIDFERRDPKDEGPLVF